MKLEHAKIKIKDIQYGEKTFVQDGVLFVNKEEVISELKKNSKIKDINIDIARQGEKVRIIPVKDVIEPRIKVEGVRSPAACAHAPPRRSGPRRPSSGAGWGPPARPPPTRP